MLQICLTAIGAFGCSVPAVLFVLTLATTPFSPEPIRTLSRL